MALVTTIKKVLTIAGSDSSGGAGIQADIKTITAFECYAMSVITALTAQNTTGVFAVAEAEPDFVGKQIDAVFADIVPDAVKIGMVANADIIRVISNRLQYWGARNLVLDPVMVATSGSELLKSDAVFALIEFLLPLARVVTPNLPEAEVLCGHSINGSEQIIAAAREISQMVPTRLAVLVKGGHSSAENPTQSCDYLYDGENSQWYCAPFVNTTNTHGTGCTLSAAIASGLAKGHELPEAVNMAKRYVSAALQTGLNLGSGAGPLNHLVRSDI